MTEVTFLDLDDRALLAQCAIDVYRASGPGGQKRNKTESAVRLRHQPTGIIAKAEESRSQHENKARALKRLRRDIALHVRRMIDIETYAPSELLAGCISGSGKMHVGGRDHRYNAAVWEILDVLYATGVRVSTTAERIGVSTANLSGFLRDDDSVWRRVNEMRTAAGLKALK
ncbi:MAG: peptide chain release factor-like protein [Phycisphaerales bacterium]|nr:peptide chain release factor-like protein [Phycisphaerales bacterium]